MDHSKSLMRARRSAGDAAVDGLLNGAVAGAAMAIYLLIISVATGASLAATLSAFDLDQGVSPVRGAVIHLAVAAIYGMVFSLIYRMIERRRPIGQGGTIFMGVTFSLVSVRKVPENKSSSILSGAAGCSAAQSKDADQASFLDQDASFDSISQKARNSAQDAFAAHYKGFRTRTSLVLWLIAQLAFATGVNVALSSLPAVHLAIAHLVYGAALGWLVGRTRAD